MKRKIYGIGYREFLLWVFPDMEEGELLPIRKSDEELINKVLNALKNEQGEVIRMRFALGGEKFNTLKQVGERINMHEKWVRQLETKALKELRQPWRVKFLGMFFRTFMEKMLLASYKKISALEEQNVYFSKLLEEERRKHKTCACAREDTVPEIETALFLETPVDEFYFSVRTSNCLKNTDVKTIGDLIKKTEREMLRTKNFGRKSLNELKKVLSEKGLGFRGQEGS